MAAGLDEADVELAAAGAISEVVTLGGTPPATTSGSAPNAASAPGAGVERGPAPPPAMPRPPRCSTRCDPRARGAGLAGRRPVLQARIGFARQALGEDWPDVSDDALLATLDDWLAPRLVGRDRTGRPRAGRPGRVLRDLVGHHRVPQLDRLVPTTVSVASGRTVPIDYSGEQPAIAVRVQDLYRHHASTRPWPTDGSRSSCTCSRPPVDRSRSPRTCPASGPAPGRRSARTWRAATRSTTGPSTPRPRRLLYRGAGVEQIRPARCSRSDAPRWPERGLLLQQLNSRRAVVAIPDGRCWLLREKKKKKKKKKKMADARWTAPTAELFGDEDRDGVGVNAVVLLGSACPSVA